MLVIRPNKETDVANATSPNVQENTPARLTQNQIVAQRHTNTPRQPTNPFHTPKRSTVTLSGDAARMR